jgi:hypothetical protein
MNLKKIVISFSITLISLESQSQPLVFFTQLESKSDVYQVIILNKGEQTLVSTPALSIRDFSEEFASIQALDKKYGFINIEGELVIPCRFQAVGFFSGGVAWAREENGKVGFIDKSGSWVIKPELDHVKPFEKISGMARVKKDDKWFYVNRTGEILTVDTDAFFDFSEGLAEGEKNGLRGFFNNEGIWVIEPKFQDAKKFKDGYASVKFNNKWGVIDKTGNWVIEAKFDVIKEVEMTE